MIDRRTLLSLGGAGILGAGLSACGPTQGPRDGGASAGKEFVKPAHRAYTGVTPTKPALPNGASAYFAAMPKEFPSVSTGVPGKGGRLVCHTFLNTIPTPLDKNKWWQGVNAATGVQIDLVGAPVGDYPSKFQAVVAGNDLPDMMAILPGQIPDLGPLLAAKAVDLTEHLAGDAILAYPNLANISQQTWDACTYNGRIFTLPAPGFPLIHGYGLRKDVAEQRGAPLAPKSGEEFHTLLKNLSNEKNKWFATNNVIWLVEIVGEMMGVPNDWAEAGGVFTKDIEAPQYPDVLEFVRKCWDEKLIHPSCWEANFSLQTQALYNSGDAPLVLGGLGWAANGASARRADPKADTVSFPMMKWDGSGPALRYISGGAPYQAFLKQAPSERVKEILSIVNLLAAPWGTKEYMTVQMGVECVNWERGADGVVTSIKGSGVDSVGMLRYMGTNPRVHYDSFAPDLALRQYEHEAQAMDVPVRSAAFGLQSATGDKKSALLNKLLADARADIITGRKPVASWATTLQDWKAKGGEQFRKELAEAKQSKG